MKNTLDARELLSKLNQLQTIRRPFEPVWEILSTLCLPNRNGKFLNGGTSVRNPVDMDDIYDGTGAQSAEYLTATMLGGLATKSLKWFKLRPPQFSDHSDITALDVELDRRTNFLLDYLGQVDTGFYTALAEATLETVALGTGCMEIYYEPAEGIRFRSVCLESIFISTNNHGKVDTLYRTYAMTNKQVVQQWPDTASTELKKAAAESPYEKAEIVRCVMPNDDYAAGKTDNYKFRSVYIERANGHILEDAVLDMFPFVVPRWTKVSDVDYGRSPAWTCKSDMEMLQAMEMTALEAAQRAAIPALLVSDDGVMAPIDHQAGGIIPGGVDPLTGRPRIIPLNSGTNPNYVEQFAEQKREAVRRAFFNNALMLQNRPQMTAEEVSTLREENMRSLSPCVLRFLDEVLNPIVEKSYYLAKKHRLFPAPISGQSPQALNSIDIEVDFDSPLANTSKLADFAAFQRYFQQYFLPLAQIDPTVMDTLNLTRAAYMNAYNLGVPMQMLNTPQEAAQLKQARQQAQQAEFQQKNQEMLMKTQVEQMKLQAQQGIGNDSGVL